MCVTCSRTWPRLFQCHVLCTVIKLVCNADIKKTSVLCGILYYKAFRNAFCFLSLKKKCPGILAQTTPSHKTPTHNNMTVHVSIVHVSMLMTGLAWDQKMAWHFGIVQPLTQTPTHYYSPLSVYSGCTNGLCRPI